MNSPQQPPQVFPPVALLLLLLFQRKRRIRVLWEEGGGPGQAHIFLSIKIRCPPQEFSAPIYFRSNQNQCNLILIDINICGAGSQPLTPNLVSLLFHSEKVEGKRGAAPLSFFFFCPPSSFTSPNFS